MSRRNALAALKAARAGEKRELTFNAEDVYDELDENEFKQHRKQELLQDDFVVGDNGEGYADTGAYEWEDTGKRYGSSDEDGSPKSKRSKKNSDVIKNRKLNFKALAAKPKAEAAAVPDDFMDDLIGVIGGSEPKNEHKKKPLNRQSRSRVKHEEDVFVDDHSYDMPSPEPVSSPPAEIVHAVREEALADGMEFDDEDMGMPDVPESESEDEPEVAVRPKAGQAAAVVNMRGEKPVAEIKKEIKIEMVKKEEPEEPEPEVVPDIASDIQLASSKATSEAAKISVEPREVTAEDGKFKFFWMEHSVVRDTLYLFGKTMVQTGANKGQFVSCAIKIDSTQRQMFVLPKSECDTSDVHEELDGLMEARGIRMRAKPVTKKYCFHLPGVPAEAEYLEVLYTPPKGNFEVPSSGQTFSHVFGANQSLFEQFVLNQQVMGPCWMQLDEPQFGSAGQGRISTTGIDVTAKSAAKISVCANQDAPMPPLSVISLAVRTMTEGKSQSVVAVTVRMIHNMPHDTSAGIGELEHRSMTFFRYPGKVAPVGFKQKLQEHNAHSTVDKIIPCNSELDILSHMVRLFARVDPDIVLGHRLEAMHMDVLLHRLKELNVKDWYAMGRLRRTHWPHNNYGVMDGRLLLDLDNSFGRSVVQGCHSFDLSEMALVVLNQKRFDMDMDAARNKMVGFAQPLLSYLKHCIQDTSLVARIVVQTQAIPLSKQLTNLAGNAWSKTLAGTRSGRNESILLHEFTRQGYIVPDKEAGQGTNKRGKAKFQGGLVLDPVKGLYDRHVLVMDFNSLYPSIIQEYNICFSTVDWASIPDDQIEPPAQPDASMEQGILPRLIRTLVQRRREVKRLIKDPKATASQKKQWDVKQMALKLTANSMYGCLGYQGSRFYAKPLANLTTSIGRDTLRATKELAEAESLQVVYGDTDSVMINTNTDTYKDAIRVGNDFKKKVNGLYKQLEIDIDGVFARLLLTNKKKYAARHATEEGMGEIEVKGLDLKRRETCQISKDASSYVLEQVLGPEDQETALNNVHEYLFELAEKLRSEPPKDKSAPFPVKDYAILKQLGKDPKAYNPPIMPFVAVALRRLERGDVVREGDVMSFVITSEGSDESAKAQNTLDVEQSAGKLRPDAEYYISKQLYPQIERLLAHVTGTDPARLAEVLGIEIKKTHQSHESREMLHPLESTISDAERFKDAVKLELACECGHSFAYEGVKQNTTEHGITCPSCSNVFPLTRLCAQLETQIRRHISKYYETWYTCSDPACGIRTTQLTNFGKRCMGSDGRFNTCNRGTLDYEYNDQDLYRQLLYFDTVFNMDKACQENDKDMKLSVLAGQNRERFVYPRQVVDKYLKDSGRAFVDMASIFVSPERQKMSEEHVHLPSPTFNSSTAGKQFHPYDTLGLTSQSALVGLGAGTVAAAARNSLAAGPRNIMTTFSKAGGVVTIFTGVSVAWVFTYCSVANLREKKDGWNHFWAGAATGAVLGAVKKSLPAFFGWSVLTAAGCGLFGWTGARFNADRKASLEESPKGFVQEDTHQTFWEVVHRRPLSLTVEQLGEGRGINAVPIATATAAPK
ncbi:DNA polymerase alpha catalytic subunit [Yarrowia sp. B02]|nr:DNA polymerase alpha catalytic subunit [Yarrowia sp. B02]